MAAEKSPPTSSDDELHRGFRAALERKKANRHATNGPHQDQGLEATDEKGIKQKRQFRRKSG